MGFNFDGGRYDRDELPKVQPVDVMNILKEHRLRYVLQTSKGTIVMKHITKRMKDRLDAIKYLTFPEARELEEEFAIVFPIATAEGAEDSAVERANIIAAELAPIMDTYALGCIEYPFITTPDDVYVLMQSLQPDEQEAVRQVLAVLTDWSTPVDYSKLEIAERFHIQVVEREHIEDPTYMQYLALINVINQERQQTEKAYKEMGLL